MTCDGKTMSVTRRDVIAIEHADGGEAEFHERPWPLATTWLAMTHGTAYRWRSGDDFPPHPRADVEDMLREERIVAYGADC